jgi:hypothetical protein
LRRASPRGRGSTFHRHAKGFQIVLVSRARHARIEGLDPLKRILEFLDRLDRLEVLRRVVEDEPIIRMSTIATIEDAGYVVLEASNADEAITLLETRPEIRVVFSDIEMPGSMDGLETCPCRPQAMAACSAHPGIGPHLAAGRGHAGANGLPQEALCRGRSPEGVGDGRLDGQLGPLQLQRRDQAFIGPIVFDRTTQLPRDPASAVSRYVKFPFRPQEPDMTRRSGSADLPLQQQGMNGDGGLARR